MKLWNRYPANGLIDRCRLLLCFLAGLLLGQACSPLRNLEKNRSSSRSASDGSIHVDQVSVSKAQDASLRLVSSSDSLDTQYSIQIWPKGTFSFDPVKGYRGEAEKMEILGRHRQRKTSESTALTTRNEDQIYGSRLDVKQHREQNQADRTVKKAVSWKIVLGYLLMAFFLVAIFLFFPGVRRRRLG